MVAAVKPTAGSGLIINLPRLSKGSLNITLIGETPLIVHRFAEKAKREMFEKQSKAANKGRSAKDPMADFNSSIYWLPDGSHGFPAIAFKNAAVTACTSVAGVTKVAARQAFQINGTQSVSQGAFDGAVSVEELVPILSGDPFVREDMVRVGMGTSDIRYRAQYSPWAVDLTVTYNEQALSPEQVLNLFNVAGFACGVGEYRPERDGQHGCFRVAEATDEKLIKDLRKATLIRATGPVVAKKKAA